jgi:hypothetical protein
MPCSIRSGQTRLSYPWLPRLKYVTVFMKRCTKPREIYKAGDYNPCCDIAFACEPGFEEEGAPQCSLVA